jgi:hypothetical protein
MRRRSSAARPAGEFVSAALKDLGVVPARVAAPVEAAWSQVAEPSWRPHVKLARIQGGVLEVAVTSAPLREELAQFHAQRLLAVLRQALPETTLVGLRFVAGAEEAR